MQQISGIYAITHLPSGRAYIGSSKDIYGRWAGHQKSLRLGEHHKARSPEMRARIGAKISATKLAKKEAKNHGK